MLVPRETLIVDKTDEGFVATTSLIDGVRGTGRTDQDAIIDLDFALQAHVKRARALGLDLPERFRVSVWRKILWTLGFLLVAAGAPALIVFLWDLLT